MLCIVLIQPHFHFASSSCYQNITKKLKGRLQTTQNRCMRFCLQLDKWKQISHEEFEHLNCLPVTYRFRQCVNSIVFNYFNEQCPNYLNKIFDVAIENNFQLRASFQCMTNISQLTLSDSAPTFGNKTADTLKRTNNLNTFKHILKNVS